VANADALTNLVIVAGNLIPRIQEAIESPLVKGLENLAFWISVTVMMFSFARLFRENDGATKDLFWWCFRLAIVFTFFGAGRAIINTWSQIGYDIVNVTEFRKVLWDAEIEFNANYEKFTEGMFLVKSTGVSDAIAALSTDDVNLRNIANAANNPASWSLPNIFVGLTIARVILQFAQIFLVLLSALITIALRLFAPFAIALAIDRGLAQRISYPFAWSSAVFTMVTPLVSHIIGYIVYQVGNLVLSIIKPETQIFTLAADGSITGDPNVVGPATAACVVLIVLMIVSALLLLASPYISYKLSFGQIFEAVSATTAGWMGALTATGIEIAGITFGSALQRQASETRIEGQAQAEIARAMAVKDASDLQSRAHKILGP
jgi:ABC-type multidrug transport system fused ATPase/permease subunit